MAVADLKRRQEPGQTVQVIVLGLWRYAAGTKQYESKTGEQFSDKYNKVYDVEVSDLCGTLPRAKLRCVVSCGLYEAVRKGILVPGHVVEIGDWTQVYDETVLSGPAVVVILDINASHLICKCGRTDHPELRGAASELVPPIVSDAKLCHNAWTREDPVGRRRKRFSRANFTISSLAECKALLRGQKNISEIQLGSNTTPICGRVTRKDRLTCYVRKKNPEEKYPFIFQILLRDESGSIRVFFWHRMALECYDSIQEGDVIILRQFGVKEYYYNNTEKEISLGPCPDATNLVLIAPQRVLPNTLLPKLPVLDLNFKKFADLQQWREEDSTPDVEFAVVGLAVHVSPWQRFRDKDVLEEFYQTRLVAMKDESSDKFLLVRVYAFSNEQKFFSSSAGQLMIITNCAYGRIGSEEVTMDDGFVGQSDGPMIITTTGKSQVSHQRENK